MKAAVLYGAGRPLEVEEPAMPAVGEEDDARAVFKFTIDRK